MSNRKNLVTHALRTLLGLIFFVFGLNGFFHFLPQPPLPEDAGTFLGALFASGYFFPLLKGTEVLAGAALLSNRFVPLALTVLAPIVVQIAAFHFRYTPGSVGLSVFIGALELALAYAYRAAFAGVLAVKASPVASDDVVPAPTHAPAE